MSGRGNCYDNAGMEGFFGTLKQDSIRHEWYLTRDEAKTSIFEYIEVFYNQQRQHFAINYQTPMLFEQQFILLYPCVCENVGRLAAVLIAIVNLSL